MGREYQDAPVRNVHQVVEKSAKASPSPFVFTPADREWKTWPNVGCLRLSVGKHTGILLTFALLDCPGEKTAQRIRYSAAKRYRLVRTMSIRGNIADEGLTHSLHRNLLADDGCWSQTKPLKLWIHELRSSKPRKVNVRKNHGGNMAVDTRKWINYCVHFSLDKLNVAS